MFLRLTHDLVDSSFRTYDGSSKSEVFADLLNQFRDHNFFSQSNGVDQIANSHISVILKLHYAQTVLLSNDDQTLFMN